MIVQKSSALDQIFDQIEANRSSNYSKLKPWAPQICFKIKISFDKYGNLQDSKIHGESETVRVIESFE